MSFISRSLLYSVIAAFIAVITSLVLFKTGFFTTVSTYIAAVFLSAVIFFAIKAQARSQNSFSTFKNVLFGSSIGLFSGCMYALWFYLYVTFINPSFQVNELKTAQLYEELKSEGLDDLEIERTIQNMSEIISIGLQNTITILAYLGVGLFSGILFSFIMKRNANRT
jgi:hypothetical protein